MVPIAYVAKKYTITDNAQPDSLQFEPGFNEGLIIDARGHPGELYRLVLVPSPARLILQTGNKFRKEVWVDQ
jgi:hypothetical protein